MAVDTIPSTPPTAAIHQRSLAEKRVQTEQTKQVTEQRQASDQQDKRVVQQRSDRIADDRKAADTKAAEEKSARKVDVQA
ncbi:MAG TPA: hypothetical protein VN229_09585 [Terriglobales bacterium]|nr:hypothetical protein [Terriglobales bacterium]